MQRRGSSLVELVAALAVIMTGLLAFSRTLVGAVELGEDNRETALATAAAQAAIEELYAADVGRVFALYNEDPADDPDGPGTAPGARFAIEGLRPRPQDAGLQGRIFFPVDAANPGELREDVSNEKLRMPCDLDLDGVLDGVDHSADYRVLPVFVRITWLDEGRERELEIATILGGR